MSSKDTHLIPSGLAFLSLVFDEMRSCCFIAACNHNRVTYVCHLLYLCSLLGQTS